MPTISSSMIPPPRSWDEFEEIVLAAAKLRWNSTDFHRNGRQGQKQQGVDIWGGECLGHNIGIQCKNTVSGIGFKLVMREAQRADTFKPHLHALYIATSARRDSTLQELVRKESEVRQSRGASLLGLLFWEDVVADLGKDLRVFFSHYPQMAFAPLMPSFVQDNATRPFSIVATRRHARVLSKMELIYETHHTLVALQDGFDVFDIKYQWGGDGAVILEIHEPANGIVVDHPVSASLWVGKRIVFAKPALANEQIEIKYKTHGVAKYRPDAPYLSWFFDGKYAPEVVPDFSVSFDEHSGVSSVWFTEHRHELEQPLWVSNPIKVQPKVHYRHPKTVLLGNRYSICWKFSGPASLPETLFD